MDLDLSLRETQLQEKRNFTISDITDFLSNELEKNVSSFCQRTCSRSILIVEEIVTSQKTLDC